MKGYEAGLLKATFGRITGELDGLVRRHGTLEVRREVADLVGRIMVSESDDAALSLAGQLFFNLEPLPGASELVSKEIFFQGLILEPIDSLNHSLPPGLSRIVLAGAHDVFDIGVPGLQAGKPLFDYGIFADRESKRPESGTVTVQQSKSAAGRVVISGSGLQAAKTKWTVKLDVNKLKDKVDSLFPLLISAGVGNPLLVAVSCFYAVFKLLDIELERTEFDQDLSSVLLGLVYAADNRGRAGEGKVAEMCNGKRGEVGLGPLDADAVRVRLHKLADAKVARRLPDDPPAWQLISRYEIEYS